MVGFPRRLMAHMRDQRAVARTSHSDEHLIEDQGQTQITVNIDAYTTARQEDRKEGKNDAGQSLVSHR